MACQMACRASAGAGGMIRKISWWLIFIFSGLPLPLILLLTLARSMFHPAWPFLSDAESALMSFLIFPAIVHTGLFSFIHRMLLEPLGLASFSEWLLGWMFFLLSALLVCAVLHLLWQMAARREMTPAVYGGGLQWAGMAGMAGMAGILIFAMLFVFEWLPYLELENLEDVFPLGWFFVLAGVLLPWSFILSEWASFRQRRAQKRAEMRAGKKNTLENHAQKGG